MALNFRIKRQQKSDGLYFRLSGDFDGASALELVRALERENLPEKKIYIDTRGLSSVQTFGQEVFVKNCAISKLVSGNLIFCGAFGHRIRPKGASLITTARSNMTH